MIKRIENWNRRRTLCKQYGFTAAIVYEYQRGETACFNRLRAKEFLAARFGQPMTKDYSNKWIVTNSDWLAYRSADDEYTIAVKCRKTRDWLLLL